MKSFQLDSSMTTLGGVFYPTGHMVLMFPGEAQAHAALRLLESQGYSGEIMTLLTPATIQREIAATAGNPEDSLPSAGTEGATVRRFVELAAKGHHGLMIHAPSARESDRIMDLLKDSGVSFGQKYRHLVIEDIEV